MPENKLGDIIGDLSVGPPSWSDFDQYPDTRAHLWCRVKAAVPLKMGLATPMTMRSLDAGSRDVRWSAVDMRLCSQQHSGRNPDFGCGGRRQSGLVKTLRPKERGVFLV